MKTKLKLNASEIVALRGILIAVKDDLGERKISELDSILKKVEKKLGNQKNSYAELIAEEISERTKLNGRIDEEVRLQSDC